MISLLLVMGLPCPLGSELSCSQIPSYCLVSQTTPGNKFTNGVFSNSSEVELGV